MAAIAGEKNQQTAEGSSSDRKSSNLFRQTVAQNRGTSVAGMSKHEELMVSLHATEYELMQLEDQIRLQIKDEQQALAALMQSQQCELNKGSGEQSRSGCPDFEDKLMELDFMIEKFECMLARTIKKPEKFTEAGTLLKEIIKHSKTLHRRSTIKQKVNLQRQLT